VRASFLLGPPIEGTEHRSLPAIGPKSNAAARAAHGTKVGFLHLAFDRRMGEDRIVPLEVPMRRRAFVAAALVATVPFAAVPARAQVPSAQDLGVFVYPAKGQSTQKQQADTTECYGWAQRQTGIDPTAPPPAPPPSEKQGADGSAVKGAAGGALVGTAIGAIAGETGEGAAIGAVAGAVRGRRKAKEQKKAQAQASEQQAQAQHAYVLETFKKAYGACLEGKGYSVK
jgi:hypothetical protein